MADPIPPIEIPWQLAATTRRLEDTDLGGPTISLFTYFPTLPPELEAAYPGESLVYLRFSVSVSPLLSEEMVEDEERAEFLHELLIGPVKRLIFDLKISRGIVESRPSDFKPYFIAATPMRREMVESGVVGAEVFSGASSAAGVGKSLSTLHESFSATSSSETGGWSLGFLSGGSTESSVSGSRDASRTLDVTNRQASEERKDLLSHLTDINNVITLLTTHHLGSPYLRFSLWPMPLRPLTIDPTDPNLWYSELLHRRSSGIEGLQDFYAIAVVPRDRRFCIDANLKQICVLQPLWPRQFDPEPMYQNHDPIFLSEVETRIVDYLTHRYPEGTSIEDELDVDFELDSLGIKRAAVAVWYVAKIDWGLATRHLSHVMLAAHGIQTLPPMLIDVRVAYPQYKPALTVWLEAQRAEFENQLLQSPLESGVVVSQNLPLGVCWGDVSFHVIDSLAAEPLRIEDWRRSSAASGWAPPGDTPSARSAAYRRTVANWNALDNELTQYALGSDRSRSVPLSVSHPAITKLILDSLSSLRSDHPLNRPIAAAEKLLGLSKARISKLRKNGIEDLRGLAQSLRNLSFVEQYNAKLERLRVDLERLPDNERPKTLPEPLLMPLNRQEADRLHQELGKP